MGVLGIGGVMASFKDYQGGMDKENWLGRIQRRLGRSVRWSREEIRNNLWRTFVLIVFSECSCCLRARIIQCAS
jgi:hypothetical protein